MQQIGNRWDQILAGEYEKEYFQKLEQFLEEEYACQTVYPPKEDIFNALRYSDYDATRVVILGQDP